MNPSPSSPLSVVPDDPLGHFRKSDQRLPVEGDVARRHAASDLTEAIETVWNRKGLFVVLTALAFAVLLVAIIRLPSTYVASAQVLVTDQRALSLASAAQISSATGEQTLGTQRQILGSRALIYRILDRLPQDTAARYAVPPQPGKMDRFIAAVSEWVGRPRPEPPAELAGPASRPPSAGSPSEDLQYRRIAGNLATSVVPDTNIIRISFKDRQPEVAVFVVNEIAREYERYTEERRQQSGDASLVWIRDQVDDLQAQVQSGEQQIAEYRMAAVEGSGQRSADLTRQIDEMGLQIARTRQEVARREALLETIDIGGAAALASGLPGSDLYSPVLEDLTGQELALELELAGLLESFGPQHPSYLAAETGLTRVREGLEQEVARIRTGIETELAQARVELDALELQVGQLTRRKAALEASELTVEALERQVTADRNALEILYQLAAQVNLNGQSEGVTVEVLSPATDVAGSARPNKKILIVAALMLSGILALVVVFVVEMQWKVITNAGHFAEVGFGRYTGQISRFRAAPIRGLVNRLQEARPSRALTRAIEQADQILVRAEHDHPTGREGATTILVTSHHRGEGKSTLALLMAHAAARSNHRVLLVDLDLRASTLRQVWPNDARDGIGVGDLARDPTITLEAGVVGTELGFDYLGPGQCVGSPTGLIKGFLGSAALGAFNRYDVVIIDSAPIGPVADSHHLFKLADSVIFSARAGKTRVATLAKAVDEIPRIGLAKVRFVLNGVRRRYPSVAYRSP